jgi:hypothetical protein
VMVHASSACSSSATASPASIVNEVGPTINARRERICQIEN